MAYKIYTKNGDEGNTSLFGGKKLSKSDIRIEAYGTVDELNSWLGIVIAHCKNMEVAYDLLHIQRTLFRVGSILATNPEKPQLIPEFDVEEITFLEKNIDDMEIKLPELKNFILPSGSLLISKTHVARTICRRAERRITQLSSTEIQHKKVLIYINRLSDYLFVLARKFAFDEKIEENIV
jgi:cob(I)alamin adenosyltransferase